MTAKQSVGEQLVRRYMKYAPMSPVIMGEPESMLAAAIDRAVQEQIEKDAVGLNLLRQIVSGGNVLRDFEVFACNHKGHAPAYCECFWKQCEAWAKADAAAIRSQGETK